MQQTQLLVCIYPALVLLQHISFEAFKNNIYIYILNYMWSDVHSDTLWFQNMEGKMQQQIYAIFT